LNRSIRIISHIFCRHRLLLDVVPLQSSIILIACFLFNDRTLSEEEIRLCTDTGHEHTNVATHMLYGTSDGVSLSLWVIGVMPLLRNVPKAEMIANDNDACPLIQ
jgi:hypothetical protein